MEIARVAIKSLIGLARNMSMDTLEAVNEDSFAIRLPESEEERIVSKCTDQLEITIRSPCE